jgi:hypothetical protein
MDVTTSNKDRTAAMERRQSDREATRGGGLADATKVGGCHWDQANDARGELPCTGVAER